LIETNDSGVDFVAGDQALIRPLEERLRADAELRPMGSQNKGAPLPILR